MPGPLPAFRPCFPDDFLREVRRLARRRAVHFQLHQRAQLVLLLHERPDLSNVEAGVRVQLHPDSVRLWRRRWTQGQFTLEDQPGRGRKPIFSPPG
jgi:hypothetical protein